MTRRDARFGTACAVLCLTWSLLGSAAFGRATLDRAALDRAERDRPPPAHTGGFSEPLCTECHIQADVNAGTGTITLEGLPHEYAPDASYALTITIAQEYLSAGGFQMSARFEDGRQAGSLEAAPSEEARMAVTTHDGVQYIHHVYAGARAVSPDTARWQLVWTAPPAQVRSSGSSMAASSSAASATPAGALSPARAVIFHIAGNAADDDESPLGDMIYATSARTFRGK